MSIIHYKVTNMIIDMPTEKDYKEFVSLVKRMREAQEELDTCSIGDYDFRQHCAAQLESEVDQYLKKMEDEE